jgi:AraC-like DNA-binding protein
MKNNEIKSCYIGPEISPEQFIPQHFFLYLANGTIDGFDGYRNYQMHAGECCIVVRNRLARYRKLKDDGHFSKVVIIFDEPFLMEFKDKYKISGSISSIKSSFMFLRKDKRISDFIHSLTPFYNMLRDIDDDFSNTKREELLLILLKTNPELGPVLFDFGIPGKIDLEEYMNRNYKFNVSLNRFAYLTGRSLSAFKRDFKKIFSETPGRWLIKRRLEEAYFLISYKNQKPSDVYLDVGFENLSHFSYAFKKLFGHPPATIKATTSQRQT